MRFLIAVLALTATLATVLVGRGSAAAWTATVAWASVGVLALAEFVYPRVARRG